MTTTAVNHGVSWNFAVTKRATPTVTVYSPQSGASGNMEVTTVDKAASSLNAGSRGTGMDLDVAFVAGINNLVSGHATAEAEL